MREREKILLRYLTATAIAGSLFACTQQQPETFRYMQQEQTFALSEQVNTQVDILWVVDNSPSMDVTQERLRRGARSFAANYLKPNWDIRMAVIPTDAYLAQESFQKFLSRPMDLGADYSSEYLTSLGKKNYKPLTRDRVIQWGKDYAKLLPGTHDGPMTSLCFEHNEAFFFGEPNCRVRDDRSNGTGPGNCLNGTHPTEQCINTVQNDTIHSGKNILSTQDKDPDLVTKFLINVTTGSNGSGSERGLGSVLQFLSDNEQSATKFFRPGALRVLIFVSDEDDQTMTYSTDLSVEHQPEDDYSKKFCEDKTIDGVTYRLDSCPDPKKLVPVAKIKERMDAFFKNLDHSTKPNYMVASIVTLSAKTIHDLEKEREPFNDKLAKYGYSNKNTVDVGSRYLEFGRLVGNGSLELDIGEGDFAPTLAKIGNAIVHKFRSFDLKRAPTGPRDMIVKIIHPNGSFDVLRADQYAVDGKTFSITDQAVVDRLGVGDQVIVNYQPKTAF